MKTTTRNPSRSPTHPGAIVKHDCIEALDLTVSAAAKHLGVTRQALSELINERTGVSVDMAIRLSKAFGSSPETWLRLQMNHDLWQARGRINEIKVKRLQAA
jgi:addiction module HigA family antidote